jgi:hypothetical protein
MCVGHRSRAIIHTNSFPNRHTICATCEPDSLGDCSAWFSACSNAASAEAACASSGPAALAGPRRQECYQKFPGERAMHARTFPNGSHWQFVVLVLWVCAVS